MKKERSDIRIEIVELTNQYLKSGGTITKCEPYEKSDAAHLIRKKSNPSESRPVQKKGNINLEIARKIREEKSNGETLAAIAKRYEIAERTAAEIVKGKIWKEAQ